MGHRRESVGSGQDPWFLEVEGLPRGTTTGALVAFLCDRAQVRARVLGRISVNGRRARVEVDDRVVAQRIVDRASGASLRGSRVLVRRVGAPRDRARPRSASGRHRSSSSGRRPRLAPPVPLPDEADHLARLVALVELERSDARWQHRDAARTLPDAERERRGDLLCGVSVVGEDDGAGGRAALTFARSGGARLQAGLSAGDLVGVWVPTGEDGPRPHAIVAARWTDRIKLVFDRDPPEWLFDGRQRIERRPDEVTDQRMLAALAAVRSARADRLSELREVLCGESRPRLAAPGTSLPGAEALAGLNPSQREAVGFALAAPDVALLHGPPGTGKTTAVVALVQAAVATGQRVLCTAPSNAAVDVLAERLDLAGLDPVRVGHPVRAAEAVQRSTLEARAREHDDTRQVRRLMRDARALRKRLSGGRRARLDRDERRALRDELRGLSRDARRLAAGISQRIVEQADVCCATLAGVASAVFGELRFDLVVIDEAAQALEPACWIAIARADRVVLAGDHHQLPPTVISPAAAAGGLSRTLFERVHALLGEEHARLLAVQYRMHEEIAWFSNERFYEGRLEAGPANAAHTLSGLDGARAGHPFVDRPFHVIDTAGAGFEEERPEGSRSVANPGEARVVARVVEALRERDVSASAIGVIAPYRAQVTLLEEILEDEVAAGLEVGTADGFQGREREAIVLSLTRSNPDGELGFLKDQRRMNVAMTRARRALVIVLDSATVAADPFFSDLLDHADAAEALTSVWELGYV